MVDLKKNQLSKHPENEVVKADCNITISDEDFVNLSSGKANPQQVIFILNNKYALFIFFIKMFMKGKLKVKGNIMLAQKLEKLFKNNAKL